MVRSRSLVSGLLLGATVALLPAVATAQDGTPAADPVNPGAGPQTTTPDPNEVPFERRPYAIRAWVAVDRGARLDPDGRARLIDDWLGLVRRFVGAPWDLQVAPEAAPLPGVTPEQVDAEALAALAEGWDKLWLIRVEPGDGDGGGYRLAGRSYDTRTRVLGPVHRVAAPHPQDVARPMLRLSLVLFTPSAEIGTEADGGVRLTIQGGALTPHDPVGAVAGPGTLFVPVRIFYAPDGSIRQVAPVGWSYLRVEEQAGAVARCSVVSSLRNPLSRRIIGRHELVAVGVNPAPVATPFRFETQPPDSRPAAGYTLTWRPDAQTAPRTVGTTDRDGRIVLPSGLADDLVTLRLLAGGVEPLVEFPVVPGETAEERVIRVNPLSEAVAVQAQLKALQDVVVDQVAIRAWLMTVIQARMAGEAWDDASVYLELYQELPRQQEFLDQLAAIREDAERKQDELKVPVLTRSVQAQLSEIESLIVRYLDEEPYLALREELNLGIGEEATRPPAGWVTFRPPGTPYQFTLPDHPTDWQKMEDFAAIGQRLVTTFGAKVKDQQTYYFVGLMEQSTSPTSSDARSALLAAQEENKAKHPNATLVQSRIIRRDDYLAIDFILDNPSMNVGEDFESLRIRTLFTREGHSLVLWIVGDKAAVHSDEANTFMNYLRRPPSPSGRPATTPGETQGRQPAGADATPAQPADP